jgi:hypothetical protein
MREDVRVAATWFRTTPGQNTAPDYFVNTTDRWLVLPWELNGLSMSEIVEHRPFVVPLLEQCKRIVVQGNPTRKP